MHSQSSSQYSVESSPSRPAVSHMAPPPTRSNAPFDSRTLQDDVGISVLLNLNPQTLKISRADMDGASSFSHNQRHQRPSSAFPSQWSSASSGPSTVSSPSSGRSDSSPERSSPEANQSDNDSTGSNSSSDPTANCILPVFGIGV